jgi:hypothetical protein
MHSSNDTIWYVIIHQEHTQLLIELLGYDQGVFGGIIVTPNFLETMGNPNPELQGTIVSLYDIGCFFGAIGAFIFGEF